MKYFCILFSLYACLSFGASNTKTKKTPPNVLTPTTFNGIAIGASKSAVQAKGYLCKDERIGDFMTLHECRKDIEFAGEKVESYATLNDAGSQAIIIGFDTYFPKDSLSAAQAMFYKFVTAVQAMLGTQQSADKTPDTYIALTKFVFPKTSVSCYLYSDERTKPPRLRCGCEISRNTK